MRYSSKAQTIIEFSILIGVAFLFFIGFLFVLYNNIEDKNFRKHNLELKEIALTVHNEIILASESIDGYTRTFYLPQYVGEKNYTINIIGDLIHVSGLEGRISMYISTLNVTGDVRKGMNEIKKIDGRVYINP